MLSDLGDKSWPFSDWSPKQGMVSHMRNCVTSEAVSDLIGKASIHPEKVSTRVSKSFIFHAGGMKVKSIYQSSPGILEPDVLGMRK